MLYWILRFLAFLFFKLFFGLEVEGKRNIPYSGAFILASNHASYLDPAVLASACPYQLNFMARNDLFNIPIFGTLIRSVGTFPVRRNFADIASIKEALRRLGQGRGLLFFPEGTRSFSGVVQRAQPGIGFVAAKSQVPVIPVFVSGTQRALGRGARFIRPAKIKVCFGQPIYPKESNLKDDYRDIARRIMEEIEQIGQERGGMKNGRREEH
jgi:1-acyl-sn-glycerol-3-phosphate acyltransferase